MLTLLPSPPTPRHIYSRNPPPSSFPPSYTQGASFSAALSIRPPSTNDQKSKSILAHCISTLAPPPSTSVLLLAILLSITTITITTSFLLLPASSSASHHLHHHHRQWRRTMTMHNGDEKDTPPAATADAGPVPTDEEQQQEASWPSTMKLMSQLAMDDQEDDEENTTRRTPEERRRDRQLRHKPIWYRKVSRWQGKGSKRRLRELWPQYGIEPPGWQVALDVPALFRQQQQQQEQQEGQEQQEQEQDTHTHTQHQKVNEKEITKVIVDVGFGFGHSLVTKASELEASHPHLAFIGCEWHQASISHTLGKLNETGLQNVRIFKGDFLHHLKAGWIGQGALDEVCVFFPDPWPRREDHDRRVVNPLSMERLTGCVKSGGYLHVATDVREYALWVGNVIKEIAEKEGGAKGAWIACEEKEREGSLLYQSPAQGDIVDGPHYVHSSEEVAEIYGLLERRPRWRPVTRYETRGIEELGHNIYDLCYRRR